MAPLRGDGASVAREVAAAGPVIGAYPSTTRLPALRAANCSEIQA
jgi:hypothetical protein